MALVCPYNWTSDVRLSPYCGRTGAAAGAKSGATPASGSRSVTKNQRSERSERSGRSEKRPRRGRRRSSRPRRGLATRVDVRPQKTRPPSEFRPDRSDGSRVRGADGSRPASRVGPEPEAGGGSRRRHRVGLEKLVPPYLLTTPLNCRRRLRRLERGVLGVESFFAAPGRGGRGGPNTRFERPADLVGAQRRDRGPQGRAP